MRIAALDDIPGNLPALEAVIAEPEADRYVMGDADRLMIDAYDRGADPADEDEPVGSAIIARHFEQRAAGT